MTTETATISNAQEREIIRRYAVGNDIAVIADNDDRRREAVGEVVRRIAGFDRGRARAALLAYDSTMAQPVDGIEQLLAAAEKSGVTKATKLAARVRATLADLTNVMKASEKELALRATISALRRQMDQAAKELKTLRGGTAASKPRAPKTLKVDGVAQVECDRARTVPGKAIRQWAKDNNVECTVLGPIPNRVRDLYEQAHTS